MKFHTLFLVSCAILISCETQETTHSSPTANTWIGLEIDESQMIARKDSFNMYQGDEKKIGSMVWVLSNTDDVYQMEDFSKFDDGSVDEHAVFKMDKSTMNTSEVELYMLAQGAEIDLTYEADSVRVTGEYKFTRDQNERIIPVDSLYNMDVFRNEIYMMLHAVELKEGTKIPLSVFANTSMAIAKSSIEVFGTETITTGLGTFETTRLFLDGGGVMPDNMIWIKNEFPRRIIRIDVTAQGLGLELVSTTGKL